MSRKLIYCVVLFHLMFQVHSLLAQTENLPSLNNYPADTAFIASIIQKADSIDAEFPDSAASLYRHAMQLSKAISHTPGFVFCALKLADYASNIQHDYPQSIQILQTTLPYLSQLDQNSMAYSPMAYNLLGNAYLKTGKIDSAIAYYTKAIDVLDRKAMEKPKLRAQIYSNMGAALATAGQYKQSIDYLKKTLLIKTIDSGDIAKNYNNLGALYANYLNDIDSALIWWNQAAILYKALNYKHKLQELYANMALGWLSIVNLNTVSAAQYLDSAMQAAPDKVKNSLLVQQALSHLYYYTGHYDAAITHAHLAIEICNLQGNIERKRILYQILSYCYAHLGDAQKSQNYQLKAKLLGDSILSETIIASINEMDAKYRLSESDKELAEKKAEIYKQRYWLTGVIGGAIILLVLLITLFIINRQKHKIHLVKINEIKQKHKIDVLQTHIVAEEKERTRISREIHDGLGVLVSAAKINYSMLGKSLPSSVIPNSAYTEGAYILHQIHSEIRTICSNLIPDYLTQKSLEEALLLLIKKMNTDSFQIQFLTYGSAKELHPNKSLAIYRTIEEIINNAIKHSSGSQLFIQFFYHNHKLNIMTEDDGKGFDTSKIYLGLGLKNIERRIQDIGGYIQLTSQAGKRTSYHMEVPF